MPIPTLKDRGGELIPYVVYDLDGTLRDASLFGDVMNEASRLGLINAPIRDPYRSRMEEWLEVLRNVLTGKPADLFTPAEANIAGQNERRTFGFALPTLNAVRATRAHNILVSKSPKPWVERYAAQLGLTFDHVFGTELTVVDSKFTGNVAIQEKLGTIAQLAAMGYEPAPRIAFGNTTDDLSMLAISVAMGGKAVGVGFEPYNGDELHPGGHFGGLPITFIEQNRDDPGETLICRGPLGGASKVGAVACSYEAITHHALLQELEIV